MGAPIAIIHGWNGGPDGFVGLGGFLRDSLGVEVSTIDLARWLSLNDEITFDDLRIAMDKAWDAHPELSGQPEVGVVTHSTGALIVRDWMTHRYPEGPSACPVKRLLMLAPANFGSPQAHLGAAFWGRLFQLAQHGSTQVGKKLLSGLEVGSSYTWDLACRDVLAENPWYGRDGVLATTLVGNAPYGGLAAIASTPGSDGTVRTSTANLNVRRASLTFDEDGHAPVFRMEPVQPAQRTAFAVLGGLDHGSITQPGPDKPVLRDLIVRALSVTFDLFDGWCDELDARTAALYAGVADEDTYYHAYENLVVRVKDDRGGWIGEYLVDFHDQSRGGSPDDLSFLFRQRAMRDEHNFSGNSAFRDFLVDYSRISKMVDAQDLYLTLDPIPRFVAGTQPVGYCDPDAVGLGCPASSDLFGPNRTVLLDVTFKRKMQREAVFEFLPL